MSHGSRWGFATQGTTRWKARKEKRKKEGERVSERERKRERERWEVRKKIKGNRAREVPTSSSSSSRTRLSATISCVSRFLALNTVP